MNKKRKIRKEHIITYLFIFALLSISIFGLYFIDNKFTGFAVYPQSNQTEFDLGTYDNTYWNGSAVVLSGENLIGTYTSKIFDAGNDAVWNNVSWQGETIELSYFYLISAIHLGENRSEVFVLDGTYYLADMKDASKNFYLNFSDNLINNSVLKIYAKKNKGVTIGIYSQLDDSGSNPLGAFTVSLEIGELYDVTLNINSPTNSVWIGEGTGSGTDPKDYFDYIFVEVPGNNLSFQVRNCSSSDCSDADFVSADLSDLNLVSQYFQYQVDFTSPDSSITPSLERVIIDYYIVNQAPNITLIFPQQGTTYGYNESLPLDFTASDSDGNLDSCWYNINSGDNLSMVDCANTTFNVSGEGNYTLNIYANDTQGEEAGDNASFNVDILSIPSLPSNGGGSSGGGSSSSSSGVPPTPIIVGNISNIISDSGETKELSLSVKNGRFTFLQDCQVIGDGEYSDWFDSSETKGLAAGESYEFSFDLKIPEVSEPNTYNLSVKVVCEDLSKSVDFNLEIIEQKLSFDLIKVERITEEEIKIIYLLKELSGLEQSIDIQFLLFSSDNEKISEVSDTRIVPANSKEELEIIIPIESSLKGELSLLINMDSESYSTFTQEDIILGAPVSGFAIFDRRGFSNNILSLILIVLFFVFTFFIVRRILKHRKKSKK